jgi:hypothetical protein
MRGEEQQQIIEIIMFFPLQQCFIREMCFIRCPWGRKDGDDGIMNI